LAGEELGELAVGPTECGEVARRGCLFAWNFTVTKTVVFTETERRSRTITALSRRYYSPPAYRLKIQPTKNHALHYSFVMFVRLSVRVYQHGSHWTGFRELLYWIFYASLSREFKFWLHSGKNVMYLT